MASVRLGLVLLAFALLISAAPPTPSNNNEPSCSTEEASSRKVAALNVLTTPRITDKQWNDAKKILDSINSAPTFTGLAQNEQEWILTEMIKFRPLPNNNFPSWLEFKNGNARFYITTPRDVHIIQGNPPEKDSFKYPGDRPSFSSGDHVLVNMCTSFYPRGLPAAANTVRATHNSLIYYKFGADHITYIDGECHESRASPPNFIYNHLDDVMDGVIGKGNWGANKRIIKLHTFPTPLKYRASTCTVSVYHAIEQIVAKKGYIELALNGKSDSEYETMMDKMTKRVQNTLLSTPYPRLK